MKCIFGQDLPLYLIRGDGSNEGQRDIDFADKLKEF